MLILFCSTISSALGRLHMLQAYKPQPLMCQVASQDGDVFKLSCIPDYAPETAAGWMSCTHCTLSMSACMHSSRAGHVARQCSTLTEQCQCSSLQQFSVSTLSQANKWSFTISSSMSSLWQGPHRGAVAPVCLSEIWPLHMAACINRGLAHALLMEHLCQFSKHPRIGSLQPMLVQQNLLTCRLEGRL